MSLIIGLDEAGYGPLLGPLVVCAATLETSEDCEGAALWDKLSACVTRGRRSSGQLLVADSKRVHRGPNRFARLEANVAPFIWLDGTADTMDELLGRLGCCEQGALAPYPWYQNCGLELPRATSREDLESRALELGKALNSCEVKFSGFRVKVVTAGELNRQMRRVGTKSAVLMENVRQLLRGIWESCEEASVSVVCDRQGGRKRYGGELGPAFPSHEIVTVREDREESSYVVSGNERRMTISFRCKADEDCLAVALASMCAKYIRELFLVLFNEYWSRRVPGLKPTAGYVVDARRFLRDIRGAFAREGIAPEMMIRAK